MPGFAEWAANPDRGLSAKGSRTPAARLRTRGSERLKYLGFNLLGYGTRARKIERVASLALMRHERWKVC